MDERTLNDLGHVQQAIMLIVWEMGEATVQQIYDRLIQERRIRYTTILTIMRRLEKAGWLEHRSEERTFIYRATSTHKKEAHRSLWDFIDRVFGGDSRLMLRCFIESQEISDDDFKELAKMINSRRRRKRDDKRSS